MKLQEGKSRPSSDKERDDTYVRNCVQRLSGAVPPGFTENAEEVTCIPCQTRLRQYEENRDSFWVFVIDRYLTHGVESEPVRYVDLFSDKKDRKVEITATFEMSGRYSRYLSSSYWFISEAKAIARVQELLESRIAGVEKQLAHLRRMKDEYDEELVKCLKNAIPPRTS